ncbi:MAG: hypothetical protein JRH11_12055 [Deltaproteobacteria bacterium]|nr:hypothetical protein [Deltaproteobacteria bacterium]
MSFLFSWRGASLASAIASLVFAAACSSEAIPVDGGMIPTDGAVTPTALLESVTEPNVALLFGEEQLIRVLYREMDGRPIAASEVEFALVGRANDSSLSDLMARTNADGEASIRVMAGSSASAFSVRVSAPRAAPILVAVSVSDAGFGELDVSIEWAGSRPVVSHRIGIFTGMTCDDADVLAGEPDRIRNLSVDEEVAAFLALPAGLVYAVTADGLSESGDAVASGCVDSVLVTADEIAEATVPVTDLPLGAGGEYSVQINFDADTEAEAVSRAIFRGGRAPVESAGGDATFVLDALEQSLRDAGYEMSAGLIAGERSAGFLDDDLATRLTMDDVGPSRAVDAVAADLATRMAMITVEGRIRFSDDDPAFTIDTVFSTAVEATVPRLLVPGASFPRALEGRLAFTPMPADDAIIIDELGSDLPLGSFAQGATSALATETGVADLSALLGIRGGCSTMRSWASRVSVISTACNGACVLMVCQSALADLASAIEVEFTNLDLSRSDLSLAGAVDAGDDSGDLRIDHFNADAMTGRYSNADGTDYDEVVASVVGASIIE